ncbi:MAG: hydrogenase maturation protease [Flammeovirgaceae bacterium]
MNAHAPDQLLVIGIGNDSRGDDGLGWRFLNHFESTRADIEWIYRYQLQIEDAELISSYQHVVFVDATRERPSGGFSFEPCRPEGEVSFSSHRQSPGAVFQLAQELFQSDVSGHVLAIAGHQWDLGQGLSEAAQSNLKKATQFFAMRYPCACETAGSIL